MSATRRSLVSGLAAAVAASCTHPVRLATTWLGRDDDKLRVRIVDSGVEAWVYAGQVFVEVEDGGATRLVAVPELGRPPRAGERVVIIHEVVRDRGDTEK